MAPLISVEEPQALLTLPRGIESAGSGSLSAPAYRVHGERKLLRSELVVGVNGDCINLYNISNPKLVAAHALPPQAFLTAAPVCTYTARGRFIYAALQDDLATSKQEIVAFHQKDPSNPAAPAAVKNTFSAGPVTNPVLYLESVPSSSDAAATTLVGIHRDGEIFGLSEDATTQQWRSKLLFANESVSHASSNANIAHVSSFNGLEASKGLFSNRLEILALLKPTDLVDEKALRATKVLLVVSSDNTLNTSRADAFILRPQSSFRNQDSIARHICSWKLPKEVNATACKHSFNHRDGSLQVIHQSRVFALDLRHIQPQMISDMNLTASPTSSITLAPQLTAFAIRGGCEVYNVRYKAIQAVQSAPPFSAAVSASKKRKRQSGDFGVGPVKLIHYFPKAGAMIGIAGNDIVSYPIGLSRRLKAKHSSGGRLIDAIGKSTSAIPNAAEEMHKEPIKSLIQAGEKRDVLRFEEIFFQAVAGESSKPAEVAESFSMIHSSRDRPKIESMRLNPTRDGRGQLLARTALSAVFMKEVQAYDAPNGQFGPTDGLCIPFMPHNVFRWLSIWKLLTPEYISRALKSRLSPAALLSPITQEAIVSAVAAADPSLAMLADAIVKGNITSHNGLVRATRTFLRSFDTVPDFHSSSQPPLLTRPSQDATGENEDAQMQLEAQKAQWELDMASILLEDGPSGRGSAIRVCCERLAGSASAKEVARSLREQMSRRDLALLIELLRFEFFNGGWTGHFLEADASLEPDHPQDEVIWVICELLNRVLDALGTGGWIGAFSADTRKQDEGEELNLIESLRSDVFAVLEGVQESNFFCGFLKDFIRYKDLAKGKTRRVAGGQGEIESDWTRGEQLMLPFGLSEVLGPKSTKVGLGGEIQRRSRRDIAHGLEKRVPVYSFERINI